MLARVNSTEAAADQLAGLIEFARKGLPQVREVPGFKGFYLLADRQSGKIVSISLWESEEELRQFEDQGAQIRKAATSDVGISPTPVEIYEVVLHERTD